MPTVTTCGQRLDYEVSGEGEPLILMHSFLCSKEMWRPQIEILAKQYTVIALDLRGHGRSAPSLPHSLYDLVEDAIAVLDAESIDEAVWCGLSIGGMISMRAVLTHPERVKGMVLIDTDGGREAWFQQLENRVLSLVARTIGVKPIVPKVLEKMFCRQTLTTPSPLLEYWTRHFIEFHVPSAIQTLRALNGRDDVLGKLQKVDCPTLVIHGAHDRALPPACGERLASAIPGASYECVEGAGHLATLEAPESVGALMTAFLANTMG